MRLESKKYLRDVEQVWEVATVKVPALPADVRALLLVAVRRVRPVSRWSIRGGVVPRRGPTPVTSRLPRKAADARTASTWLLAGHFARNG